MAGTATAGSSRAAAKTEPSGTGRIPALATQFGFAQLDFPGILPLADGRYLARSEEGGGESVLVVQTLAAPPAVRRRRRRTRSAEPGAEPRSLPLTRVTAIRAFTPFDSVEKAARWLDGASEAEDTLHVLLADGVALLNRALHARAVAAGDPVAEQGLSADRAVAARIGFGSGEETARSRFREAREVDPRVAASVRRRREEELRPQERVAAVLGGRERLDACETMLLRARADLDAGRAREAALQLRVGLQALLVEIGDPVPDPGHREDVAQLRERDAEAASAADAAAGGELSDEQRASVRELVEICERILRRRRVLHG